MTKTKETKTNKNYITKKTWKRKKKSICRIWELNENTWNQTVQGIIVYLKSSSFYEWKNLCGQLNFWVVTRAIFPVTFDNIKNCKRTAIISVFWYHTETYINTSICLLYFGNLLARLNITYVPFYYYNIYLLCLRISASKT